MSQQTIDRLKNIFEDVFIDEYEISVETTADDIDEWDSMAQINLVKAIEDDFNISLDLGEVSELENIGALVALIDSKKA